MRFLAQVIVLGGPVEEDCVAALRDAMAEQLKLIPGHAPAQGLQDRKLLLTFRARSFADADRLCNRALDDALAAADLGPAATVSWTLRPGGWRHFLGPRETSSGHMGPARGGPGAVREPRRTGPEGFPPASEARDLPPD